MPRPFPVTVTVIVIVAAPAGWLGWRAWRLSGGDGERDPASAAAVVTERPPDRILTGDPVEIFQKAFWKRPEPADHILHAERREWVDNGGISRWQWFLEVQPSPSLVKYLRTDNAFGLSPVHTFSRNARTPEWFPRSPESFDLLQNPTGSQSLLFSKDGKRLYATDSGGGFRPAVTLPASTAADYSGMSPETRQARLPLTPPPESPPDAAPK